MGLTMDAPADADNSAGKVVGLGAVLCLVGLGGVGKALAGRRD